MIGPRNLMELVGVAVYRAVLALLSPLNWLLLETKRKSVYTNSVLHISYMVHIPYYTVRHLRRLGMKADYLAVGAASLSWNKSDFQLVPSAWPPIQAIQEFVLFWKVVAKYEVIHSHFMITLSKTGWELPVLKKMGRKLVVHYRGCEIRDREYNMRLHPEFNICENCDYNEKICKSEINAKRRQLSRQYGDLFLVSTPDMKDFAPHSMHFPFFSPEKTEGDNSIQMDNSSKKDKIKIVHVTNHPGIEGTEQIQQAIENLKKKGYSLTFTFLKGVCHDQVMKEFQDADLAIGKMKMGYYANAQIESMALGVPTITYVRPEFMTEELKSSGFIFCTPAELQGTIRFYLDHPEELNRKKKIVRKAISQLHNNADLANRLMRLYDELRQN